LKYWRVREELSRADKVRRSYYELLRDDLDLFMLQYALIDSYRNFLEKGLPYPFVERRELKPRARIPDIEHPDQNTFLILFVEDAVPAPHKKYIRFFEVNRTSRINLLTAKTLPLSRYADRSRKFLESVHFYDFLRILLPVDYALLIQRDPESKFRDGYTLSHFHVRIDWPIADAAEDLARSLRYISKDLYEKGDKYAEDLQKKFFEYYGVPVMAGGRRTAAIVAAQYLRRISCITTIYAGSSESRALMRLSERGVSKAVLMKLPGQEMDRIAVENGLSPRTFRKRYLISEEEGEGVAIFLATYVPTQAAVPPDDGKLRELKPDLSWQTVAGQHILPKSEAWRFPPIPYNVIYA
jgi:hypothetical protein